MICDPPYSNKVNTVPSVLLTSVLKYSRERKKLKCLQTETSLTYAGTWYQIILKLIHIYHRSYETLCKLPCLSKHTLFSNTCNNEEPC